MNAKKSYILPESKGLKRYIGLLRREFNSYSFDEYLYSDIDQYITLQNGTKKSIYSNSVYITKMKNRKIVQTKKSNKLVLIPTKSGTTVKIESGKMKIYTKDVVHHLGDAPVELKDGVYTGCILTQFDNEYTFTYRRRRKLGTYISNAAFAKRKESLLKDQFKSLKIRIEKNTRQAKLKATGLNGNLTEHEQINVHKQTQNSMVHIKMNLVKFLNSFKGELVSANIDKTLKTLESCETQADVDMFLIKEFIFSCKTETQMVILQNIVTAEIYEIK